MSRIVTLTGTAKYNNTSPLTTIHQAVTGIGEPQAYENYVKGLFQARGWDILAIRFHRNLSSVIVKIGIEARVNDNISSTEVQREAIQILNNVPLNLGLGGYVTWNLFTGTYLTVNESSASQLNTIFNARTPIDNVSGAITGATDDLRILGESGLSLPMLLALGVLGVVLLPRILNR